MDNRPIQPPPQEKALFGMKKGLWAKSCVMTYRHECLGVEQGLGLLVQVRLVSRATTLQTTSRSRKVREDSTPPLDNKIHQGY